MSIYVGNLSYDVTQEDLNDVFAEYGTVSRVQVPMDRETGRSGVLLLWKWQARQKKQQPSQR